MENSLKIETFNKICRTCLSVTENLLPLFKNEEDKPDALLECLNILKVLTTILKKSNFLFKKFI